MRTKSYENKKASRNLFKIEINAKNCHIYASSSSIIKKSSFTTCILHFNIHCRNVPDVQIVFLRYIQKRLADIL